MAGIHLPVQALIDPVLRDDGEYIYGVPLGGMMVDFRQWQTTSYSNTNVTWSTPPPEMGTFVDPRIFVTYSVTLTITGTAPVGVPLLQIGTGDGLRAWPLMNAINTGSISMTINNASFTQQMDVQQAMMRYGDFQKERNGRISTTPTMMDQYQNYGDWVNYGSARNPLALHGENFQEETRGGFTGLVINSNPNGAGATPVTATVTVTGNECFWFSPLAQWQRERGLTGIQTWQWTMQILNFAKMWSHDAINGNTITSIAGTWASAPLINFRYITSKMPLDRPRLWPFNDITARYVTAGISLAPGATTTLPSSTITLDVVPRIIYVFLRPTNNTNFVGTGAASVSDTYARINTMVMQWGGQGGIFANMTVYDIFNMCRDNGFNGSWNDYNKFTGSVVAIRPGIDFPLPPGIAAGVVNRTTFSLTQVSYTNVNTSQTYQYDLYIVPITAGVMEIGGNSAQRTDSVIDSGDVMKAESMKAIPFNVHEKLAGGSIWDTLKGVFNTAVDYARPVLGVLKNAPLPAQYAAPIRTAASLFGAGRWRGGSRNGGGFIDDSKESQYGGGMKRQRLLELPR